LANNLDNFKDWLNENESTLTLSDKYNLTLRSALCAAHEISAFMFEAYPPCCPDNNYYYLSYAISAKDEEWVLELIKQYKIDILDPKYCFLTYAKRFDQANLITEYHLHVSNSKLGPDLRETSRMGFFTSPSPTSFAIEPKVIKEINPPKSILNLFEKYLLRSLRNLQTLDESKRQLVIDIIKQGRIPLADAVSKVKFTEIENLLSTDFQILYCSSHPYYWMSVRDTAYYKDLFIKLAKKTLRNSSIEGYSLLLMSDTENLSPIINALKKYANRFLKKHIKDLEVKGLRQQSNNSQTITRSCTPPPTDGNVILMPPSPPVK
jgi:hypothetical protein